MPPDQETPPVETPPVETPPVETPPASERPEGIPDELWGDSGFNADAFKAYRAPPADLPATADAYELPTIEGVEIDAEDPLVSVMRQRAFEAGIGQEGFNGFLTDYATKLKEADDAAYDAAIAGLGDNAQARIDALSTQLDGKLPKEEAEAVRALATSAEAIKGLERLLGTPPAIRDDPPLAKGRKTLEEIRALMATEAYSGKPDKRSEVVIKEVTDWFAEDAKLKAKAQTS